MAAVLIPTEILVFGASGHGIIGQADCPSSICPSLSVVIVGLAFKCIGVGLALGALGALLPDAPARLRGAMVLWSLQYLWALVGIARAYQIHFGTSWAWWEPFVALIWNPVLTPAVMIAGLALLLGIDRFLRRG